MNAPVPVTLSAAKSPCSPAEILRAAQDDKSPFEFTLDGQTVQAFEGETIFKAAKRHGVDIPHLCYKDGYRPDGNCRACVVEVKGERALAPSCCRNATAGMEGPARRGRAPQSPKKGVEKAPSDKPERGYKRKKNDEALQHSGPRDRGAPRGGSGGP